MSAKRTPSSLLLLALLLGNLCLTAVPSYSAEAAPVAQGENLLNSPGFEGIFGSQGTDSSWAAWHQDVLCGEGEKPSDLNYACRPEWSAETVTADLMSLPDRECPGRRPGSPHRVGPGSRLGGVLSRPLRRERQRPYAGWH